MIDAAEPPTLLDPPPQRPIGSPSTLEAATLGPAGLPSGTIVDGRYRVLERIGAGGSATVFRAHDLRWRRPVALKVLRPELGDDPVVAERFRREACAAMRLRHDHIVRVHDGGVSDGTHYIAMEYVAGRSLSSVLRVESAPPPARAKGLVLQILEAARFMHLRGVIHRDLKPQNVIVDRRGRVKVTDLGIAYTGRSDITPAGSILGTVHYMSPELVSGGTATAASDLYSVGVMLYELLTGRRPFEADLAVTVALKHVNARPAPPARLNPAITPELQAVVMRALEKAPSRRFSDASAFIAALKQATAAAAPPDVRAMPRAA